LNLAPEAFGTVSLNTPAKRVYSSSTALWLLLFTLGCPAAFPFSMETIAIAYKN